MRAIERRASDEEPAEDVLSPEELATAPQKAPAYMARLVRRR